MIKISLKGAVGQAISGLPRLIIPSLFLIFASAQSAAFEGDVFTLESSPPEIEWLSLPDGWETRAGVMAGTAGGEFILFFPKGEGEALKLHEYDWPPRIIARFPIDTSLDIDLITEDTHYLEFSALLDRITLRPDVGEWELTLFLHRPLPKRIEEGEDYGRIHIQFLGTQLSVIERGNRWRLWEINRFLAAGLQHAYIIQLDPMGPDTNVRIVTASQYGLPAATVQYYARFTGALGAVNGGYYSYDTPLGLVMAGGNMLSPPQLSRPVLAFADNGGAYIGGIGVRCRASIGGRSYIPIDTINDFHSYGPVLLTPNHPPRIRGDFTGLKVVIENGLVIDVTDGQIDDFAGRTIIWDPDGTSQLLRQASTGESVVFNYELYGLPFEPYDVLQAGPILVENSRIADDFSRGSFKPDITAGRSPRTAAAITINGEVLLFMGEGRLSIHSLGFSLQEVAELLILSGAHTAINLDGGGSSSMYIGGRYYGFTPAGFRMRVPSAVVFGSFRGTGAMEYPF